MKALWLMLAIMLSATCAAMADSPVMPYTVDVTAAGPQFVVRSRVANTPVLRFYTKFGTNVWNPSGYSGILFWSPSINDPSGYQINSTTSTSSYVDFVVPTNGFSSPCKDWYCAFGLTTGDVKVTYAEGLMTLDLSPEFTGNYRAARTALLDGNQYRWTNVPFMTTNQVDGSTIVYGSGVIGVPAGIFDPSGSSSSVSNWAAGRFNTLTGTWAYLSDVAGLSNAVWEALGDYVPKSATNGWEVSPHLPWLTDETLWNAASNTVVYTNTPAYTDAVAKASSAYPSSGGTLLGNMFMSNGKYIGVTSTLGQVFMTAGIAPSYAPALSLNGTNATLGGWIQIAPTASGNTAIGNPAVPRSSVSVPVTSAGYHLWMSNGVMIIDGAGLYNVTPQQVGADAAGSAAAVSNAAWSQGWITAGDIPAETDPIALLPDGSRPMTGNLNMGGFSVTNISTNSLTFSNGTSLSSPSNGALTVNGAEVYTTANHPPAGDGTTYVFDPIYLRQTGTSVTLADWLPNMVLANWFETRMRFSASSGGWEDGLSYVFDDQSGILTNRSSGYAWQNPWYANSSAEQAESTVASNGVSSSGAIVTDCYYDQLPITFSAWVNLSSHDDYGRIICNGSDTEWGAGLIVRGENSLWLVENEGRDTGYVIPLGEWKMLTGTIDIGGHAVVYVDGIEVYSDETGAISGDKWSIFNETNDSGELSHGLYGMVDECAVWARALSSNEVFSLYADGGRIVGTKTNDALFIYHMDDAGGTTITNCLGDYYHGAVTGGISQATGFWGVGTIHYGDIYLAATNTLLDYIASNALWRALISVTNPIITTNEMRGYVIDLTAGTTNWCDSITLESTTDLNNKMWGASITNLSLGTNLAAGVWASSNVSVTVKGIGAIYAP